MAYAFDCMHGCTMPADPRSDDDQVVVIFLCSFRADQSAAAMSTMAVLPAKTPMLQLLILEADRRMAQRQQTQH